MGSYYVGEWMGSFAIIGKKYIEDKMLYASNYQNHYSPQPPLKFQQYDELWSPLQLPLNG
jgi:hypothetical protein